MTCNYFGEDSECQLTCPFFYGSESGKLSSVLNKHFPNLAGLGWFANVESAY